MWNALAGFAGLVSVGQQAFFGLGAYLAIQLSYHGIAVYPALLLGALVAGIASLPISYLMLRLRAGEFAIGMWVVAELAHLLVALDPLINGETGVSMIALSAFNPDDRRAYNYWMALAAMVALLALVFLMLRGRLGTSVQSIRDDEDAANRSASGYSQASAPFSFLPASDAHLQEHFGWQRRSRSSPGNILACNGPPT